MSLKIVFMGTPEFAVPCLESLYGSRHRVVAVVTQPDKPKGRGFKITPPPVKEFALEKGIPVFQPSSVKEEGFLEELRRLEADLFVTVAYGKILPEALLAIPPRGCINVHASLLPQYRGAAPIQWSIIRGEAVTGVTTMMTDVGLDTGDMLLKSTVDIGPEMTGGELHDRLSEEGAGLLMRTLDALEAGSLVREPQDHGRASYAPILKKEHGEIRWDSQAQEIHNLVRGVHPWPGAHTYYQGRKMRIWKTKPLGDAQDGDVPEGAVPKGAVPGTIVKVEKEGFLVATGRGGLRVEEIQFESARKMNVGEYLCGNELLEGEVLGIHEQ